MTSNKKNLYTVNIVRHTFPTETKLQCGQYPREEVVKFLKRIRNMKIPADSCAYHVTAQAHHDVHIIAMLDYDDGGYFIDKSSPANVDICFSMMPHDRKCNPDSCLKNIKSGRCTDPFVRDNFAARFFADKYTKQK